MKSDQAYPEGIKFEVDYCNVDFIIHLMICCSVEEY